MNNENQFVTGLKSWFEKLSNDDKKAVLRFLYEGKQGNILIQEGLYLGPRTGVIEFGLHMGPKPTTVSTGSRNVCPTCGKPL